ncbi:MAG: MFS transporter [Saprospiraceae bacterium]
MNKDNGVFSIIDPKTTPFFYGWVVLGVGTLGFLMSAPGQTIGVSAFTDSLLDVLSLSRDQLSFAYMGGTMLSAVALTKAGQFYDEYGARRTTLIATIGLGIALLYLSQIDIVSTAMGGGMIPTMVLILIGFVFIRFFGQGVLSLASRTMVVKWFDAKRGLAVGIMNVFGAFGFSIAPVVFDALISGFDWSGAWIVIAIASAVVFPVIVAFFFKESPERYGLHPDGYSKSAEENKNKIKFPIHKEFTLLEARKTLSLWVFAGYPALFGLVATGFTFHVVSIFAEHDFSREAAIGIFQPIAAVSVVSTVFFSWISDHVKLKYLAYMFSIAAAVTMYGLINLQTAGLYYWLLIGGYGVCSGIHGLVISLFLPRFYGKKFLGAITGQAMTLVVFASAIGPILFSQSLSLTGSYSGAAIVCGVGFIMLLFAAFFTHNPQESLSIKNM